jgi:GNAT superfamily N-acetyltransferase
MTTHGSAGTRLSTKPGSSVVIEPLARSDLERFREIDRSEEVTNHYRQVGRRLVATPADDSVPNFHPEGELHSIPELVKTWQPVVDAGGRLLGASEGGQLAGIALLGGELAVGIRQVALLYVSRPHRRRGIATALMDHMRRVARSEDARALYVSSTPTDSAVGFYLSRGFQPTEPLPELFRKEPDDIHMLLRLAGD